MKPTTYDAIVVGSGATGGWAAKQLAERGLKTVVLEAGRKVDPKTEYTQFEFSYEMERRGFGNRSELERTQPIQSRCYACNEYSSQFFVNDLDNPYTTPPDRPFSYIRARIVGGRTLPWGRQSYRLNERDFKPKTMQDGYGDDWPISYKDIEPYYDMVEEFVGVSGSYENMWQLPDGKFHPAMKLTCGEWTLKRAIARMNDPLRRLIIGRAAIMTKPIQQSPERVPCYYCGHCDRGCTTGSFFSSPHSTLPAAERSGNMTLVPHAVVSHVILDKKTGRASGVAYIDDITREHREVHAKVVLLCAGSLESTRILLNSPNREGTNGIANSSGVLGHYLMDHINGGGARGTFAQLNTKEWLPDGRANGIYIPRFQNWDKSSKKDYIRGFGYQGGSGQSQYTHARTIPGFGADFKRRVREDHPWGVSLGAFGECLPYFENHVRIDKEVVDAWGIPVLHIDCAFRDNELKMIRDMGDEAAQMLEAAGAKDIVVNRGPINIPGHAIHEVGTARMGDDPKTSVLNKYCQAHDVKNLFVTDGAAWVSVSNQNITLTLMAITAYACDHIAREMRAGRL